MASDERPYCGWCGTEYCDCQQQRDELSNPPFQYDYLTEDPQRQEPPLSDGNLIPEVYVHSPPQFGTSEGQKYQSNEPHDAHQPSLSSKLVDQYTASAEDPWTPYNIFQVGTSATPPRPQTRGPYSSEKKAKINHLRKNGGACSRCRRQKRECSTECPHRLEEFRQKDATAQSSGFDVDGESSVSGAASQRTSSSKRRGHSVSRRPRARTSSGPNESYRSRSHVSSRQTGFAASKSSNNLSVRTHSSRRGRRDSDVPSGYYPGRVTNTDAQSNRFHDTQGNFGEQHSRGVFDPSSAAPNTFDRDLDNIQNGYYSRDPQLSSPGSTENSSHFPVSMPYPSQDQATLGLPSNNEGPDGQYIAEEPYGGIAQSGVDELLLGYPLPGPLPSPAALSYTYGGNEDGSGNGTSLPHGAYQYPDFHM